MKEPLEELFKQSLEGHEMPYNPDAWTAMNARLDAISPVVAPRSYLKYYIAAAGIGVAAVSTYLFFTAGTPANEPSTASTIPSKENTTTQTNNPTTGVNGSKNENTSVVSNPSETTVSSDKKSPNGGSSSDDTTNPTSNPTNFTNQTPKGPGVTNPVDKTITDPNPITSPETWFAETPKKLVIPTVPDLCMNEEFVITNTNGSSIYLFDALNRIVSEIPANKSLVFKPAKVGTYALGYKNDGKNVSTSHFKVNRVPDAEFSVDLINKYEDGLPSTHVEAISGQGTYTWTATHQSANGVEADLHFYKKGAETIELTVSDGQCSASVKKSIYIEDDFNLLAPNSFTPTSNERKNQTFMPYALTQRNVNFRLVIIDGIDGGVVYETTDAGLPWDGTDIRSGKRNLSPQVYIWKVVILNPAANEPNEYRGTVIMN